MREIKFRAWMGKRMMLAQETEVAMSLRGWRQSDYEVVYENPELLEKENNRESGGTHA